MSSGAALEIVDAATADYPAIAKGMKAEAVTEKQGPLNSASEELIGPMANNTPRTRIGRPCAVSMAKSTG